MKEYNDYLQMCSYNPIGTIVAPSVENGTSIILIPQTGTHYALESDKTTAITELNSTTNGKVLKLYYDETNKEVFSENEQPTKNSTLDTTTLIIIIAVAGVVVVSVLGVVIIAIKKRKARRF